MIAPTSTNMREVEDKLARLARTAHDAGVSGRAAGHPPQHRLADRAAALNRVDSSREAGTARLLVAADGRRFVLANAIEMPRHARTRCSPASNTSRSSTPGPPTRTRRSPSTRRAPRWAPAATLGADWPLPTPCPSSRRSRARAPLTEAEIARYRALGRDAGLSLGDVCRRLTPGDEERDIAATIADALAAVQRPRCRRARGIGRTHPSISSSRADRYAAGRHVVHRCDYAPSATGSIVSVSRIVAAGAVRPIFVRAHAPPLPSSSACSTRRARARPVRRSSRRPPTPTPRPASTTRSCGTTRAARSATARASGSRTPRRTEVVAGATGVRLESDDHGHQGRRHRARPRRPTRDHHVHARLAVDCHQPAGLRPRGRRRLAPGLKVR